VPPSTEELLHAATAASIDSTARVTCAPSILIRTIPFTHVVCVDGSPVLGTATRVTACLAPLEAPPAPTVAQRAPPRPPPPWRTPPLPRPFRPSVRAPDQNYHHVDEPDYDVLLRDHDVEISDYDVD
jgi:hypothetical protein